MYIVGSYQFRICQMQHSFSQKFSSVQDGCCTRFCAACWLRNLKGVTTMVLVPLAGQTGVLEVWRVGTHYRDGSGQA
jgi:hypothetical protein